MLDSKLVNDHNPQISLHKSIAKFIENEISANLKSDKSVTDRFKCYVQELMCIWKNSKFYKKKDLPM